jgi:fibronectin type 3 domain-containing protein
MTIDDDDFLHIVYYQGTEGLLMYATDITRPSEPLNVTATGGERDILVEWDPPSHLGNSSTVTYNIYGDHVDSWKHYDLVVEGLTDTSFLDTEVKNRYYYHYWVVAVNGAGEGLFSQMVYDRAFLHPTTPLNVTATAGPDNVVLRWEPPEDPGVYIITGYRIQWRSGTYWSGMGPEWQYPLSEWSNITTDGSTRTYNHTGLKKGYPYHYQISALHSGGEGELSEDVFAIPMVPPSMPVNLTAYRMPGRVVINWTPSVDDGGCRLTAYRVYRGTSPFDPELLTQINGSAGDWNLWGWPAKRLVDDGTVPEFLNDRYMSDGWNHTHPADEYDEPGKLKDDKTYYYRVSAVQLAGEGPLSPVLEVPPEGTPNMPQHVRVREMSEGVEVSWDPPVVNDGNGAKGFVIYRLEPDGELVRVQRVGRNERSYLDTDVWSHATYTYYVRGVNSEGEGMSSDHAEITVGEVTDAGGSEDGMDMTVVVVVVLVVLVCLGLVFIVLRKRMERIS